jgi:hypothetical protein
VAVSFTGTHLYLPSVPGMGRLGCGDDDLRYVTRLVSITGSESRRVSRTDLRRFPASPNEGRLPGIGIGFAIIKRIIDPDGGMIRVESTLGEGSTVF